MKKFKITFYEYNLSEEVKGILFIKNTDEVTARKQARKICNDFDWFYSIEEIY